MLQELNLNQTIDKDSYKILVETMGLHLSELQRTLRTEKRPSIILFHGWDASGKGTVMNRLLLNLDPRGFSVHAPLTVGPDEEYRPHLWPYWIRTPSEGQIAIFEKAWYEGIRLSDPHIIYAIAEFERMLADSGVVLIKFFFHVSSEVQKKRFEKLESSDFSAWRVTKKDLKENRHYQQYLKDFEELLSKTNFTFAPWQIIEADDSKHSTIKVFEQVIGTWETELDLNHETSETEPGSEAAYTGSLKTVITNDIVPDFLSHINLNVKTEHSEYEALLSRNQERLRQLEFVIYQKRLPVLILFEGCDAAGKGGTIKRLCQAMDPRGYRVHPVAAPSPEEQSHHYLWRFWKNIPKAGHIAVFDRTWYGRVLVERVEGFAKEEDWRRAYNEINAFEHHLHDSGAIIIKFWLHIDRDEQLKRFKERTDTPEKQWKITDEDWRNREKWPLYQAAINEMVHRTDTDWAPWYIIPSNDKLHARIETIETVIRMIDRAVNLKIK